MKALFLTTAFFSVFAYANDTKNLEPGQTIELITNEGRKSLHCKTSSAPVDKFCVCIEPGPPYMKQLEKHYVFSSGRRETILLGRYGKLNECENALEKNPACK